MSNSATDGVRECRPDVDAVLSRLKGFQRDTVEHAFHRLYEVPDSSHRFLVADEVGLGKTLVARGVVARTIEHLWEGIGRIDVVYICSNANIARQNVRRLNPMPELDVRQLSRLTLLPTAIEDLNAHKVNFIAFTPGTSFNLRSSGGTYYERVVLYWLLQEVWPREGTAPKNLFQGGVQSWEAFRWHLDRFDQDPNKTLDPSLVRAFGRVLGERVAADRGDGRQTLEERYDELLEVFPRARNAVHPDSDVRKAQFDFIGELRALLARTCVNALEPDLVILDEFQRFKTILDGEDEAGELAQQLFEYSDDDTDVRILLLSATPYKMYTLHHESDEDDHYTDFLRTVAFLDCDPETHESFRQHLSAYRRELYRLADGGDDTRLAALKRDIESHLRRHMSRTERVRSTEGGDAMLREVPPSRASLELTDVRAFQALSEVAGQVGQPGVIEYWKSAPYLLSFMDSYKLKTELEEAIEVGDEDLARLLRRHPELSIPWKQAERYEEIDPQNPRLRTLLGWLAESRAWQLLWLPPTIPYHRLEDPFRTARAENLTKRLIFSSWAVVPKTLASLLSYEVERRVFQAHEEEPGNTAEDRTRRRRLLNFAIARDPDTGNVRLTGMPVLGLLYPSPALARRTDPLVQDGADAEAPLSSILEQLERRLQPRVDALIANHATSTEGREDEAWYWATPLLLDLAEDSAATRAWFEDNNLATQWAGEEDESDADSRWLDHVERARELLAGEVELGPAPADLVATTALLGLAGPANVALRALTRRGLGSAALSHAGVRHAAGRVAWGFRSLFNQPEAMAILRADQPGDTPYWKLTLRYAASGCLQAVLDEYTHLVRDLDGWIDDDPETTAVGVAKGITAALTIRTSNARLDEITTGNGHPTLERRSLRNHFALRFGAQKSEEGGQLREESVRGAFNSPFWPFVLATTSRGQEGLDFHAYSHAVVHWNLPANPVDLEQREGRVHRYKGHALRRNVARRHGADALTAAGGDVWERLFELAANGDRADGGGLLPYWVYPGDYAIERHVPRLPLSRDDYQLSALRRSLAVYRMVFGQPRQDDLMAYLLDRVGRERLEELAPLLRVNLSPPASGGRE